MLCLFGQSILFSFRIIFVIVFATYQLHIAGIVRMQTYHTLGQTEWRATPVNFSSSFRMSVKCVSIVNQFFASKTVGRYRYFWFMIMCHTIICYLAAFVHLQCCLATERTSAGTSVVCNRTARYTTFVIEMTFVQNFAKLLVDVLIFNGIWWLLRILSCGIEMKKKKSRNFVFYWIFLNESFLNSIFSQNGKNATKKPRILLYLFKTNRRLLFFRDIYFIYFLF